MCRIRIQLKIFKIKDKKKTYKEEDYVYRQKKEYEEN